MSEISFKNLIRAKEILDTCFKCSFCKGNCPVSEHGESYNVMRAIKQLFDPNNILCPGTIFKF